jgi:hypothetical protein
MTSLNLGETGAGASRAKVAAGACGAVLDALTGWAGAPVAAGVWAAGAGEDPVIGAAC